MTHCWKTGTGHLIYIYIYMGVSKNGGTPNHPFWKGFPLHTIHFGVPLFLETPIYTQYIQYIRISKERPPGCGHAGGDPVQIARLFVQALLAEGLGQSTWHDRPTIDLLS